MNKALAIVLGVLGHLLFLVAVSLMGYSLFWGLTRPIIDAGSMSGLVDAVLLLSFPIGHSLLLSGRGRRFLAALLPAAIGKTMVTTTFAIAASLQVGLFFAFWTPVGGIWFEPYGILRYVFVVAYAFSWLALIVSIYEAGLGLQTGAIGWLSVVMSKRPSYPDLPCVGLHGKCRHPIYQSFLLILLTGPVWGPDHLLIASVWGAYCVVGPLLKEQRLRKVYGSKYESYAERVPYYALPKI